ncbi:MAG: MTH938/NDUFAF3 family protein, partial [Methylophilaceae bacterium]
SQIMKFHEMTDSSLNYISAYEENWVKIKNKKYDHSIFILSDSVLDISNFSDTQIIELIQDSYSKKKLELVIIASPNNEELNKLNKYKDIIQMQIGFEFMKTDAAYRTFNIILSESREVGLLLYFN